MKTWIILVFATVMTGCGSAEKGESSAQIPVSMECPASQDPSQGCPSPSAPELPLGQKLPSNAANRAEAASRPAKKLPSISGRCELWVAGEKSARSCAEVKVMIRSTEKGEMRDGVVEGFGVVFSDLNEKSYKLLAQSEDFLLTTPDVELKPGRKVVLKIKAKPRKR